MFNLKNNKPIKLTHLNQVGGSDPLMIPLIVSIFMIVALTGFGLVSYSNYSDASELEPAEIAQAVAAAESDLLEAIDLEFADRAKQPYDTYISKRQAGSIKIVHPKNWSAFIDEANVVNPINGYFHPGVIPDVRSDNSVALRIILEDISYSTSVEKYIGGIQDGAIKARSITVSGVTGARFDGAIEKNVNGVIVVFPIRDKTLKIWTESIAYLDDFENPVLKNLEFVR